MVSPLKWACLIAFAAGTLPFAAHHARAQDTTSQDERWPPAGFGSLRQEDIAVRLDWENVQFRVMPLDELILRLLAPDSYTALHSLREASGDEIRQSVERFGVTEPVAFLVTVFGKQDQAEFDPERLVIISRNRLFRPIAILSITPLWNQHRVSQRETAAAIYLFENGIAMLEPFTVESDGVRSDQWERSLRRIERERARIANRQRGP